MSQQVLYQLENVVLIWSIEEMDGENILSILSLLSDEYKNKIFEMITREELNSKLEKKYENDFSLMWFEYMINTFSEKLDWYWLCRNTNITFDIVEKYSDKPWDWDGLSRNPNITFDIVEKYIDKPWNWTELSINPNITFDIIEKYSDKPWDLWCGLSMNPNITIDIVEKYRDKGWSWYDLSLSLIHISEPTRRTIPSRMPSSA